MSFLLIIFEEKRYIKSLCLIIFKKLLI